MTTFRKRIVTAELMEAAFECAMRTAYDNLYYGWGYTDSVLMDTHRDELDKMESINDKWMMIRDCLTDVGLEYWELTNRVLATIEKL